MVTDKFGRAYKRPFVSALGSYDGEEAHDLYYKRLARVGEPEEEADAVTKKYLESVIQYFIKREELKELKELKGTVDQLASFFDIENRRILRLNTPIAGYNAVTKTYVDDKDKLTKQQIRAECEKVKREALAEGGRKREEVRKELSGRVEKLEIQIKSYANEQTLLQKQLELLNKQRRIDAVFVDALYKHLNVTKSSVQINVD